MGEVRVVTELQVHTLDLVGKPVSGLDGEIIGKVTSVSHEMGRDGSSTTYIAKIDDDKAWEEIRARMSPGPVGISFGGTAKVHVLSIWERIRMSVGNFFIRLGRKIGGKW